MSSASLGRMDLLWPSIGLSLQTEIFVAYKLLNLAQHGHTHFFYLKAFSEDSCLHRAAIHFKVGLGQYVPTKSPTDVNHLPNLTVMVR